MFRDYDLAVGSEPAVQTVEKVRRSVIADALSSGLTEWFFVTPEYPGLLAVVDLLDPDPARATLRAAIVHDEKDRVKEIAKTIDGSRLAPAYAIGLATHPAVEDGVRILKAAWATHPDSFPLSLTITGYLGNFGLTHQSSDTLSAEAAGWGRTAVALRPNNPLAHYYHAAALSGSPEAVDELNRTIRLAPRFAKAYGRLAFVLQQGEHGKRQSPEALAAARKAIELDNQNVLGHYVLYVQLWLNQKDYHEAAREYRTLSKLFQGTAQVRQPDEASEEWYAMGWMDGSTKDLLKGLIDTGRPSEAYRLILDGHPPGALGDFVPVIPSLSSYYIAARAAAPAGTGQGVDAPPPAERPAARKRALEWLMPASIS